MNQHLIRSVPIMLAVLSSGAVVHAEPPFRYAVSSVAVRSLGTLGGRNSYAYGINEAGHVVGWAETTSLIQHAFLYRDNSMIDISVSNVTSTGRGINNADVVVGSWHGTSGSGAFRWAAGSFVALADHPPGEPAMDAAAVAINKAGLIAGNRGLPGSGETFATVWTDDTHFLSIDGTARPQHSIANDINDAGLVVGRAEWQPKVWQLYPPISVGTDIPPPATCAGASFSAVMNGVNRPGAAVGYMGCAFAAPPAIQDPIYWSGGPLSFDMGVPSWGGFFEGLDINDQGFMIGRGRVSTTVSPTGRATFIHHPDFGYYVLPQLTPTSSGTCDVSALNGLNTSLVVQIVGVCESATPGRIVATRWDVKLVKIPTTPPGPTP